MTRDPASLTNKEYDLVIIGAGIFGACASWDAVQRGLSVALIEKSDFCQATSAHHFKMIHGGMRYLQHLDLPRVRSSSYERTTLFQIAPHLAYPIPILMPTYGHGIKGKEILRTGFFLYELLTTDRNRRIRDPSRRVPKAKIISPREVSKICPSLEKKGLTGGVIFYDGQLYNPPRLVLSFVRSAVNAGLDATNYLEAEQYILRKNRVVGVRAKDYFSGDEIEIRGKTILNTCGPWAHQLNERILGKRLKPKPSFSRDLAMVISRPLTNEYALAHPMKSQDEDALLDRGGRHVFVVPWRGYSLVGVWHQIYKKSPEEIIITDEELQGFINEVNQIYHSFEITLKDVSMLNTGLILFGNEHKQGIKDNHSFGKRSLLLDHSRADGLEGLITLIGVRATTARKHAEKAVDLILRKLGREPLRSRTADIAIYGGQICNFEKFVKESISKERPRLDPEVVRALAHNHGSEYAAVLKYAKDDPMLTERIGDSTVLKAEIIHAVWEEMACKLEDVVFRRTDLGTAINPGDKALESCAQLMAKELGWNRERQQKELTEVRNIFSRKGPWRRV